MEENQRRPQRMAWMEQPLPLARLVAFGFALLIAYASLNPFGFNLDTPVQPWAWMSAPMPKYITLFDVGANILGYLPFGFFMIFAVFPKFTKWSALWITLGAGMFLSGILESLQIWIPGRISSNVDWWANSLGAMIGGLFALPIRPVWLSGGYLDQYRHAWFGKRPSFFILFLLFPWAQIYPQNAWLAMGDLGLNFTRISMYWSLPNEHVIQEVMMTSLSMLAVASCFFYSMKLRSPKIRLFVSLIFWTILIKSFISGAQFGLEQAFNWLTFSAVLGMLIGITLAAMLRNKSSLLQWNVALIALLCMIVMSNILPTHPYQQQILEDMPRGRLTHFIGLLGWLSWIWPALAIYGLIRHRFVPAKN